MKRTKLYQDIQLNFIKSDTSLTCVITEDSLNKKSILKKDQFLER